MVAELLAQHAVLLAQILDHLHLVLIHPSGHGEEQEPERIQDFEHLPSVGSSRADSNNQRCGQQIELSGHTRSPVEAPASVSSSRPLLPSRRDAGFRVFVNSFVSQTLCAAADQRSLVYRQTRKPPGTAVTP